MQPVISEIELVLDQKRARVRVIADAVAMNEGVHEWKAQQKQGDQPPLVAAYTETPMRSLFRGKSRDACSSGVFYGHVI